MSKTCSKSCQTYTLTHREKGGTRGLGKRSSDDVGEDDEKKKMEFKPMPSFGSCIHVCVCLFGVRAKCILMEYTLCVCLPVPAYWAQFQFAACYPSSLMECLLRVTMLNRWLVTHQHQMDQHNNNNNHKSNNFINTFSHRLDAIELHCMCMSTSSRSSIPNRISKPNPYPYQSNISFFPLHSHTYAKHSHTLFNRIVNYRIPKMWVCRLCTTTILYSIRILI